MIDPDLKRSLGQMTYGVTVVAATSGGTTRAYASTWVAQVSFEDPVIMASVSPKHDTFPLIEQAGWFTVSLLAGDQLEEAQYFSYPGRRFRHIGDYLAVDEDVPYVRNCVAWLSCKVMDAIPVRDHVMLVAEVTAVGEGRLDEPALTYSSRKGWRIAGTPARRPGESVRDRLLARLKEAEEAGETPPTSEPPR